jgi:hypothetical protein
MRSAIAAFLAGAGAMALEILASRWLAPSFGAALTPWSLLISATLLAGTLGALLGGRLARRGTAAMPALLLVGAAWAGACALGAPGLVRALEGLPVVAGAAAAAVAILGVPVAALAAVLPLAAVRGGAGAVGRLVAASTFGSLAGTLLAALAGVPLLGLRTTALGVGAALSVGAAVVGSGAVRWAAVLLVLALAATALASPAAAPEAAVVRESVGGTVVLERVGTTDVLRVDGVVQGAVPVAALGRGTLLRARQWVEVLPYAHPRGRRALAVGLGAGVFQRVLAEHGVATVTIEVNPDVVDVVRRHLGFDGEVLVGDGRARLRDLDGPFDFAVLDAFQGESLPAHLVTREAFEAVRARLAPGAIVCLHLIGRPQHRVTGAVAATLGAVWPSVLALRGGAADEIQDLWLLAADRPVVIPPHPDLVGAGWRGDEAFAPPGGPVLTDDRNPIDLWSAPLAQEVRRLGRGR